jgi:hypothetical protein
MQLQRRIRMDFKQGVDNPSMPHKEGSWYMFNNQPLIEVFDELEQMFNVHIVYAKKGRC